MTAQQAGRERDGRSRRGGGAGTAQFCRVEAGSFTVFLPHDIHMPNLQIDGPAEVKKVVIKVRL